MKKLFFLLFISLGILAGCKEESGPTIKTENPAKATIATTLVVDTSYILTGGPFEFGQKLYFSKNGNITKLGCKMGNQGSFRVSLWDFTTQNLIVATTINVTDTTQFIYNSISSTAITANTRYVISINNNSGGAKGYYLYKKKSLANIMPFTTGSVTYEANLYAFGGTSTFPLTTDTNDYFGGIPDLQFEYTE